MNVTELAHWKYRIAALTADVTKGDELLRKAALSYEPWLMPGDTWDRLIEDLKQELALQKWLLEEAHYMSILGTLA